MFLTWWLDTLNACSSLGKDPVWGNKRAKVNFTFMKWCELSPPQWDTQLTLVRWSDAQNEPGCPLGMRHVFEFTLRVKSCPPVSQRRGDWGPAWRPLTCLLLYKKRSAIRLLLLWALLFEGCVRDSSISATGFTKQLGANRVGGGREEGGGGGEAFGPSSPLSHVPKKTGRHLSKLSSKITFKPPKWGTLSCVLWPNGGSVAIDIAVSKGQHQVFPIRLEKATGRLCGLQWLWQACHTTQFTELHNSIQIYENTCSTGIKNKTLNNRSTNYKFRSTERSLNNAFLMNVDDVVV